MLNGYFTKNRIKKDAKRQKLDEHVILCSSNVAIVEILQLGYIQYP